ncbi:unnamed protein product [Danaus chrysippus]|uniref:(African queen) hypothetical protein n=1 Tax=Danaus chrysippus TaxID=151541 RepID=A0A8J2R614_9NEOP|nr:unnamed protein product [Danaus chrysippus]
MCLSREVVGPQTASVSDILVKFGRYQILQYTLVSLPILFLSIINVNYIFVAGDVKYRCRISECDSSNATYSVPWFPNNIDPCTKPIINHTYLTSGICTNSSFTGAVEKCTDWIYENHDTIIPELNLACKPWKKNLVGLVHSAGMALAMLIGGVMADHLGRKNTLIICGLGCFIGNFKTLASNYNLYIFIEFLEAVISGGVYTSGAVLMVEIAGLNKRVLAGVLFSYSIYSGEAIFALVGMVVPYWKTLIYIICSPPIIFLSYFLVVNESPRWLILKGKNDQAKEVLKSMAKSNKINIDFEDLYNMDEEKLKSMFNLGGPVKKQTLIEAFKSREIAIRFLVAAYCRFACSFVYYGLLINSVVLPGDKYTNFFLAAMMSFPGELISMFLMNKIGRKLPLIFGFLLGGISCIVSGYATQTWLKIFLFLLGKLVASSCYTGVVTYTVELFPTSVRGSLIGLCALASAFGNMLSPLTPALSPATASIFFGCAAFLASCLLCLTPETKDTPLLDTIEQIDNKKQRSDK